jgi:hypothetical protein
MSTSYGLAGGAWTHRAGGVRVFVEIEPELKPQKTYDLTKLVACLTCGATVTQSCRVVKGKTRGRRRAPHEGRLAPKLCVCGGLIPTRAQLCHFCAVESIKASKRDYMRRKRGTIAA